MKNAQLLIYLAGIIACLLVTASLAQSFMNTPSSTSSTSGSFSGAASSSNISTMQPDEFKNTVNTLGSQNQAKLAALVQQLLQTSSLGGSGSSSTGSGTGSSSTGSGSSSTGSSTGTGSSGSQSGYSGFGTGSSGGSSSGGGLNNLYGP